MASHSTPNYSTSTSLTGDSLEWMLWHWKSLTAFIFLFYVALCSTLRFQRINQIRRLYQFHDRSSLSRMTYKEAQEIARVLSCSESPTLYDFSLRLALFRTYAVEGVGKLLYSSSDLAKVEDAPKRYEDTALLYSAFFIFPVDSDHFLKSVARMNYLHSPYIKAGKILNRDLLYVLWASMSGPIRFFELYEWRPLTDMEVAAQGTIWLYIGKLMGIDYQLELGKEAWADGIEFVEHVTQWAERYEDDYMKPHAEIRALGKILMELLLSAYPKFIRSFIYKSALVAMGERMRYAFGLPEPTLTDIVLTYNILLLRKLSVRYLALPRLHPVKFLSPPDTSTGRINRYHYLKEPWYVRGTFWRRWNPMAMLSWTLGYQLPGDNGSHFKPQGFVFEDIGPKGAVGKGADEMERIQETLHLKSAGNSCPFSGLAKT